MIDVDKLNDNIDDYMQIKIIKEQILNKIKEYGKTLSYMAADAPISVLCLPKVTENALLNHGCLRVYDLFDCDFSEVKGLGVARIRYLTTRLNEFVSVP